MDRSSASPFLTPTPTPTHSNCESLHIPIVLLLFKSNLPTENILFEITVMHMWKLVEYLLC